MTDKDGLAFIGTIENIIMGGLSSRPVNTRGEVADTTGMIGCPRDGLPETLPFELGESKLKHGDRCDVDGVRYRVVGKRLWDYNHSMTGRDFGYYWVHVQGTTN